MEQATSAELRAQMEEAISEATRLAERRSTIDEEIRAKEEEIRAARLNAARNGQPVGEAGADLRLELEGLLAERENLPEEHFAGRERAAELGIAAEQALIREVAPQVQQARSDLRPLEEAAAEAVAAASAQATYLAELEGVVSIARQRSRRHEELLAQVEAEGARPLY